MRVDELVKQAGLANPGLANAGHDLAMALARFPESAPEDLHLSVTPDEPAEPSPGQGLNARPRGAGAGELEGFDGLTQSLDIDRP